MTALEFDYDKVPDGFRLLVSDCLIAKGPDGSILTGPNSSWASLDVDASGPGECAGPTRIVAPASTSTITSHPLPERIVVKDRVVEIDKGKLNQHPPFSEVLGQQTPGRYRLKRDECKC
jgi:hypothetical protein